VGRAGRIQRSEQPPERGDVIGSRPVGALPKAAQDRPTVWLHQDMRGRESAVDNSNVVEVGQRCRHLSSERGDLGERELAMAFERPTVDGAEPQLGRFPEPDQLDDARMPGLGEDGRLAAQSDHLGRRLGSFGHYPRGPVDLDDHEDQCDS
jgi:hypothetical protein